MSHNEHDLKVDPPKYDNVFPEHHYVSSTYSQPAHVRSVPLVSMPQYSEPVRWLSPLSEPAHSLPSGSVSRASTIEYSPWSTEHHAPSSYAQAASVRPVPPNYGPQYSDPMLYSPQHHSSPAPQFFTSQHSAEMSLASTRPALNLHWQLLSYHVARPNLFLHFDVAFPIHDIEYRQNSLYNIQRTPLCDADLDKPAADKKLTNMTINFWRNPLEWNIYVKRDQGIRVRDVFEAIYSAFDIPLTPYEKNLIPLCLHARCEEAFRLRCNLAPVLPIVQQRLGWKRIDALLHETVFRGLTQSESGRWTLNLSWTVFRGKQDSNIMNKEHLISDSIAMRYWRDLMLAAPIARHWLEDLIGDAFGPGHDTTASHSPLPQRGSLMEYRHWLKDLSGDVLGPDLETTASYSPLPQPDSLVEYLPPYPNPNPDVLLNYSNNDLFKLPLSATFVPRTGRNSDIMLPLRNACRICNFARLSGSSAIIQHRTLCNLLNNIPPLIPEPSSRDYTWAFFCKFVPLCALFDSPGRGPLPMIQLSSDCARLVERLEVDLEKPKNTMLWLHGPPGSGKSVVAYTLASRCRQNNRLAGSFFFSRRHANCRSARSLLFALVYQLGLSQPQAKEKIIEALDNDPVMISPSRDLREQFARLLIEPLEAVDWRSSSRVFVIDAIDQCQDQVPELISLLTRLLSHLIDVGLHIFFTSRDHVQEILIKRHFLPIITDITLDHTDAAGGFKSFLRQSFDKIHRRHRLQCPKPWPPDEVLNRLADSVGPHFITGSIIVKFVDNQDHDPTDRMDLLCHLLLNPSSSPELTMDNFYKYIISTADDMNQAYLHLTLVTNVVGMLSCSQLDSLLKRGLNQTFDLRSVLSQLSPLVHIPDSHDSVVEVCHESLCDFLSDSQRCGKQFIPQGVVHRLLAYSSLNIMMEELAYNSPVCSALSRLTTESIPMSLRTFDNAEVLALAIYSPPEPLPFLSTLWHITQRQSTGLQADSRTALALRYFCHSWQILQHLDLSTVDALPAFRFLANIRSLPVLLAFPIFLAFESSRSSQTLSPSTQGHEFRIETLHAVAEIVNDVHTLKDQCTSDSYALHYACSHWAYHLSLAEWDDDLRSILTSFMEQKLQQWLIKALCLQNFESCIRTLCEVQELCSTANNPIRFGPGAQRLAANTKTEAKAETENAGVANRGIEEAVEHIKRNLEAEDSSRHRLRFPPSLTHHSPSTTFSCRWLVGENTICGFQAPLDVFKTHFRRSHFPRTQDGPHACYWQGCNYCKRDGATIRTMRGDAIWRHVREVHLGPKRNA